jgi:hypothetical protein
LVVVVVVVVLAAVAVLVHFCRRVGLSFLSESAGWFIYHKGLP